MDRPDVNDFLCYKANDEVEEYISALDKYADSLEAERDVLKNDNRRLRENFNVQNAEWHKVRDISLSLRAAIPPLTEGEALQPDESEVGDEPWNL